MQNWTWTLSYEYCNRNQYPGVYLYIDVYWRGALSDTISFFGSCVPSFLADAILDLGQPIYVFQEECSAHRNVARQGPTSGLHTVHTHRARWLRVCLRLDASVIINFWMCASAMNTMCVCVRARVCVCVCVWCCWCAGLYIWKCTPHTYVKSVPSLTWLSFAYLSKTEGEVVGSSVFPTPSRPSHRRNDHQQTRRVTVQRCLGGNRHHRLSTNNLRKKRQGNVTTWVPVFGRGRCSTRLHVVSCTVFVRHTSGQLFWQTESCCGNVNRVECIDLVTIFLGTNR